MKTKHIILGTVIPIFLAISSAHADTVTGDFTINNGDLHIKNYLPFLYFNDSHDDAIDWTFHTSDDYFRLYDYGSNTYPFKIWKSSENNLAFVSDTSGDITLADGSVFIDKSKNFVGIGTTTPEKDIQVVNTTTVTTNHGGFLSSTSGDASIKLDAYDNSSWSIGARYYKFNINDEASKTFAITDNNTTNSPFVIYQGAPTGSLNVYTGSVNIGTKLDVRGEISTKAAITSTVSGSSTEDLTELIALSRNNTDTSKMSDTGFMLENKKEDVRWTFRTLEEDSLIPGISNSFAISKKASGDKELIITGKDSEGGMTLVLANGAKCDRNGNWINQSTRSSKENITALSSEDAMAAFHKLQPMTYNYKGDTKESYVGFIAEDVPDLVAINSRDGLGAMDMVAVLTKVVQEQEKLLAETRAENKVMKEEITELKIMKQKVAQLESLLTNLALDTSNTHTEKVSLNK